VTKLLLATNYFIILRWIEARNITHMRALSRGYRTTRKWNLKVHLERVHGLFPFLPERSQEEWVWAQFHTLAGECAKAQVAGDREKAKRFWDSLIGLYRYHRGLFPVEYIAQAVGKEKRELEKRIG